MTGSRAPLLYPLVAEAARRVGANAVTSCAAQALPTCMFLPPARSSWRAPPLPSAPDLLRLTPHPGSW